jgi:protein transport protein HofB
MSPEKLMALCQRHNALLLNSTDARLSIAVQDQPAPEMLDALRFATQKNVDIECWSAAPARRKLIFMSRC